MLIFSFALRSKPPSYHRGYAKLIDYANLSKSSAHLIVGDLWPNILDQNTIDYEIWPTMWYQY